MASLSLAVRYPGFSSSFVTSLPCANIVVAIEPSITWRTALSGLLISAFGGRCFREAAFRPP